jgi:hypothetical protein
MHGFNKHAGFTMDTQKKVIIGSGLAAVGLLAANIYFEEAADRPKPTLATERTTTTIADDIPACSKNLDPAVKICAFNIQ